MPSPLNLWMNIPFAADGTQSWGEPLSKPGDYVILRAELDCIVAMSAYAQWGPYNVHDPAVIKADDGYYYCYSTDVGYGIKDTDLTPGLQVRRSKDLVDWQFVGWVFTNASEPAMGRAYITQRGGTPNRLLWAPYVLKVGSEYRLYYSLASNVFKLSVIGLATASSPTGPWTRAPPRWACSMPRPGRVLSWAR